MQRIRPVVTNRKIIRARREVGNKCRCTNTSLNVASILLCEVPLNKDTRRERGRGREVTAAVELPVNSTRTKSNCAEVDDAECVRGGDNHRMHYFTSRPTAVPYMTDSYT